MNRLIVIATAGMPHLLAALFIAVVVSGAVALLGNRSLRDRVGHSVYLAAACMAGVIAGSWLMFLIHG